MSFNKYIKNNDDINNKYQKFKEKKDIDFKRDINIYIKPNNNLFKSKSFKLSVALTILLLIISITAIGINYINKPKYQEFHFTKEEIEYIQLGITGLEDYKYYYDLGDALLKDKYISYSYVTTTFKQYIAGYYSINNEKENDNLANVKWYMFKDSDIPYSINKENLIYLIQCDEEYYHKDIITNIEINKTRDRFSKCSFDIDIDNNKIKNIKRIRFNDVNEETLKCISRINNNKDLQEFDESINISLLFVLCESSSVDTYYLENYDYYNIIIKDNKRYVLMNILEEEHNKLLIEQLIVIEKGEIEIDQTYNNELHKSKRKLYLLEDIIALTQAYGE